MALVQYRPQQSPWRNKYPPLPWEAPGYPAWLDHQRVRSPWSTGDDYLRGRMQYGPRDIDMGYPDEYSWPGYDQGRWPPLRDWARSMWPYYGDGDFEDEYELDRWHAMQKLRSRVHRRRYGWHPQLYDMNMFR